jgi:hypothetical protein
VRPAQRYLAGLNRNRRPRRLYIKCWLRKKLFVDNSRNLSQHARPDEHPAGGVFVPVRPPREQGTKTEYLLAYSNLTQHLQYNKGDNKYIKGFLPVLILPGRGPRAARRFVEGLAVPMTERKGIIALHVFLLLLSLAGSP